MLRVTPTYGPTFIDSLLIAVGKPLHPGKRPYEGNAEYIWRSWGVILLQLVLHIIGNG
jgi:hypothetical protein